MEIRTTTESDLETILSIHQAAFDKEEDIAGLVNDLLKDSSAEPVVSLLALDGDKAAGHVLFTRAQLTFEAGRLMYILAPLAVIPDYQKQGIGKQLVKTGIGILDRKGTDLIFVLGHPEYYPVFGFRPAGVLGYDAPFPIPDKDADAWMVLGLNPVALHNEAGTVICADAMNKPEHWRE